MKLLSSIVGWWKSRWEVNSDKFLNYSATQSFQYSSYGLDQLIGDTVAACVNVRSEMRSLCTYEVSGNNSKTVSLLLEPVAGCSFHEFVARVSQHLDSYGNYYLHYNKNTNKFIEKVADNVVIIRKDNKVVGYKFGGKYNDYCKAEDTLHLRRYSVQAGSLYGRGVISEQENAANADMHMIDYMRRFFKFDTAPNVILEFPAGTILTADQIEDIRRVWNEKMLKRNRESEIAVIHDGGKLSLPQAKEVDYQKSSIVLRDRIRHGFGVPAILFGDVVNVNLNNGLTAYLVFIRTVLDPFHLYLSNALSLFLTSHGLARVTIKTTVDAEGLVNVVQSQRGVTHDILGNSAGDQGGN